jgi:hypothetical protein
MGLRDRYLSALGARCVGAVPSGSNTQQPAKLLHVAPPMETPHATTVPARAMPTIATLLHATNDATTAQHAQQADHEAKVERSGIVSADGVPYWEADDLASLPTGTAAEIVLFDKRVARSTWLGYSNAKGRAEMLLHRDRAIVDLRLCIECSNAGTGWRCSKREAFMLDKLQRCTSFKEKPL